MINGMIMAVYEDGVAAVVLGWVLLNECASSYGVLQNLFSVFEQQILFRKSL